MRRLVLSILAILVLALPAIPQSSMSSVEPASGKVGDLLTIRGTNLGPNNVSALYLTDGTTDIKVAIVEQAAEFIRFKIPSQAKAGRFALMILTGTGSDQRLVEQPIKITVLPDRTGPTVS